MMWLRSYLHFIPLPIYFIIPFLSFLHFPLTSIPSLLFFFFFPPSRLPLSALFPFTYLPSSLYLPPPYLHLVLTFTLPLPSIHPLLSLNFPPSIFLIPSFSPSFLSFSFFSSLSYHLTCCGSKRKNKREKKWRGDKSPQLLNFSLRSLVPFSLWVRVLFFFFFFSLSFYFFSLSLFFCICCGVLF